MGGANWQTGESAEAVPWVQFTPVHLGLVLVLSQVACCPSQTQIGAEGKDDGASIDLRFNARTLGVWRQRKVQRLAENDGVGIANGLTDHGVIHLGLKKECGRVRPVQHRKLDSATVIGEVIANGAGKRARPGDAGNSGIAKLIALAGIHRKGADGGLPLSIRRTGLLAVTRSISGVHYLEGSDRAAHV